MTLDPRAQLPPGPRHAGIGAAFVRDCAIAGGAEERLANRLALIAEEVLGAAPANAGLVGITLADRRHSMRLSVDFTASDLDLAGLDQSRRGDIEEGEEIGLYLAARLADRLTTEPLDRGGLRLAFDVGRAYPALAPDAAPAGLGPISGAAADPDDATLALLVQWAEAAGLGGPAFRTAPRVLDQRAQGDLFARVALDARRRPVGGLFWRPFGRRLMELAGPALLLPEGEPRAAVAEALLEAALAGLVRKKIQGLVVLEPSPDMPRAGFETVGHLPGADGASWPVLFRALEEDPGGISWVSPALKDWVTASTRRLALGRDIEEPARPKRATGAAMAAETDRARGRVTLRSLIAAGDAAAVAAGNVALFRDQGFSEIRALLDLGKPDQAAFAEALVQAGLAPAALIPDAAGDLLLLAAAE